MSHEIEQMAYIGQTPWHGLGNVLPANTDLNEWVVAAGLNWGVKLSDVYYYADPTALRRSQTRKVLYRDDTLEPISVVSDRYKPVQPIEILEFYRDLISVFGFQMETAGSLKNGAKVWALANTKQAHFVANQDEVKAYLLLATSYDGTLATTAQFTSVRVVCNNTLQMAVGETLNAVKIGHHQDFDAAAVKEDLGLTPEAFAAFTQAADALAKIRVDAVAAQRFYRNVLEVVEAPVTAPQIGNRNLADRFTETFNERRYIGSDLEATRGTAWGMVNVVTEYLDHVRRQSAEGWRLDSAWFGTGARIKQRTFTKALELA